MRLSAYVDLLAWGKRASMDMEDRNQIDSILRSTDEREWHFLPLLFWQKLMVRIAVRWSVCLAWACKGTMARSFSCIDPSPFR